MLSLSFIVIPAKGGNQACCILVVALDSRLREDDVLATSG